MRILFATTAGAGHFAPMTPVARACLRAGHEVAVAAPASFAGTVGAAGLRHLPFADADPAAMGEVYGRLPALSREEANRVVVAEIFGRLDARAALPGVAAAVDRWQPDLVVREPCELASLVIAERAHLPQVQVAISVDRFVRGVLPALEEPLEELAEAAGLARSRGPALMAGTRVLTSVPPTLDTALGPVPGAGDRVWRYRADEEPADASLPPAWGDPAQPLVLVSLGSVTAGVPHLRGVYAAVLAALADLPVRVLLTTGQQLAPEELGPVPANACVLPWWPQAAVLPHAALVVGHGGFGTTMGALAAGVPQVVLPLFAADQFVNAESVAAVGAGTWLPGGPDDVPGLAVVVREVLSGQGHRDGAARVAAEIAGLPGPDSVVPLLEGLVAEAS